MFSYSFNPEEKEIILDNLHAIERYVKTHWANKMRPYESITIDTTGSGVYCPLTTLFGVTMDARGFVGKIWYRDFCFISNDIRDRNIYENWKLALDIFTDWEDIKAAMNDEVEKLNNKRKAILEFRIEGKSKYKDC